MAAGRGSFQVGSAPVAVRRFLSQLNFAWAVPLPLLQEVTHQISSAEFLLLCTAVYRTALGTAS